MSRKRTHDEHDAATAAATDETAPPPPLCFDNPDVLEVILGSDFVEPLDLLKCMYLNKQIRRVAAAKLNNFQYDTKTKYKQEMFVDWLRDPTKNGDKGLSNEIIQPNKLEESFVILKYESTYNKEKSQVAIIDKKGHLVAIYKFYYCAGKSYKPFPCWKACVEEDFNLDDHCLEFENSGHRKHWKTKNAWKFEKSTCVFDAHSGDLGGDDCKKHYALYHCFKDVFSPEQTIAVLMHALSLDTYAICSYYEAVENNENIAEELFQGGNRKDDDDARQQSCNSTTDSSSDNSCDSEGVPYSYSRLTEEQKQQLIDEHHRQNRPIVFSPPPAQDDANTSNDDTTPSAPPS